VTGPSPIGEAWFTSNRNQTSAGNLGELIAAHGQSITGSADPELPLLLKFLFTSDRLSIQVHPGDDYARVHHNSRGKTEAWHVIGAVPGAQVAVGLRRELTREEAENAIRSGEIEDLVAWHPARAGDTFLIEAGTIHAIGGGLQIVEVQEQSDITYRLYDYGRPRELHLEHGLAVCRLGAYTPPPAGSSTGSRRLLTSCDYFRAERWQLPPSLRFRQAGYYHLMAVLSGCGEMGGQQFQPGEVWLIPAQADAFDLESTAAEVLLFYNSPSGSTCFTEK
jgi:mannose-6-phosphate isomerase